MLKVNYGQLRNPSFARGVMKIAGFSGLRSPKLAFQIAKIHKKITEENEISDTIFKAMVQDYAEKGEDGKIKPHKGIPDTYFVPEEKQAEWLEKVKEFEAIEFTIDQPPFVVTDKVMECGLSGLEISALDPIICMEEPKAEDAPPAGVPTGPKLVTP